MKTVLGVFTSQENAEEAMSDLESHGYQPKDISIVMQDHKKAKQMADETGGTIAGNTASGAVAGIVIGGVAGLASALLFPGFGPFLIGGPIATALGLSGAAAGGAAGAATGAVAGGLIGALAGFGLSSDEAKTYEERVKAGAILLIVPARIGQSSEVEEILDSYRATDVKTFVANTMDDDANVDEMKRAHGHETRHVHHAS